MLLVLIVNTIFRANRLAGVAMVWLTNPVTVVPVYWWNYMVGVWTLGQTPIGFERFSALFDFRAHGLFEQFLEFLQHLGDLGLAVALPLTLGGLITGLVLAVIGYPLTLLLVRKEREAIERLRKLRRLRHVRHLERLAARTPPAQRHASNGIASVGPDDLERAEFECDPRLLDADLETDQPPRPLEPRPERPHRRQLADGE